MEIEMRSSRHDFTNGDISSSKHGNAEKIFNRYVGSVDTDQRNGQLLKQMSEIQSLLQEIKNKEKKKMDNVELQIRQENKEIATLKERLQSVTKTKEQPQTDDVEKFRVKYITFCTIERKEMCKLLESAEKPCKILQECYNYCESKHKQGMENMMKEHLLSSKPTISPSKEVSQLQKQFAAETSKCLLKTLKEEKPSNDLLWISYDELWKTLDEKLIDSFFEKSLELCWIMVSECSPMKFSFDKHIKSDKCEQNIDLTTKPNHQYSKKRPKQPKASNTDAQQLVLKYPAVIQKTRVITKGLKQRIVF